MNEARAYFAACVLEDQYVYVMGGLHDFQFLSNIEKYDYITDTWISLYFKLPAPLSKLCAISLDKRNILIMGGMSADFEPTSAVYNLDVISAKFIKKASMRHERLMDGGAFLGTDKFVYALNGSYTDTECERYQVLSNRWELIPSHQMVSNHKPINDWVGCLRL